MLLLLSQGLVQLELRRPLSALIEGTDTAYRSLGSLRGEVVHAGDVTEAGCAAVDSTGSCRVLQDAGVV